MKETLDEISGKAGSALLVLGLCASIFFAQSILKASGAEILLGVVLAALAYFIWLISDFYLDRRTAKKYSWLYTVSGLGNARSLSTVESGAHRGSKIFLVTPDMHNDARNAATKECVRNNLADGVEYVYLTRSNDDKSKNNIDAVLQNFSEYGDQIQIYTSDSLFQALPTHNILVIDNDLTGERRAFVELPVSESLGSASPRAYWVEADSRFTDTCHERILVTLKGMKPEENPYSTNKKA